MTRSGTSTLESFDPEIERTFRRLRNLVKTRVSPKKERPIMEETPVLGAANMEGAGNGATVGAAGVQNNRRTLMEYAQPSIDGTASCICDMFRANDVPNDAIRLRLFSFSLKDRAREWLNSLLTGSISD